MTPDLLRLQHRTRRHFLTHGSLGLGGAALALMGGGQPAYAGRSPVDDPTAPKPPHFPAKAKRVIYLHMSGSPPHLDLFDYKPELVKRTGQDCPDDYLKGKRFAFTSGVPKLLGTPRKFEQHGKNGMWMSDAVPHFHGIADDMCMIRSMKTDEFNHAPAELFLFTGHPRQGRPGMGSWVTYGLGSEAQNLPGFVVLISSGVQPSGGANCWGPGFLPSVHQGVQCRSKGDPVLYVSDPPGMDRTTRRKTIDAINDLNALQADDLGHPETATRISQYEMAFRMQTAVPEVMDISRESKDVIADYGATPGGASFANNCLLARRLAQQGVRFVQLFDWGWDFHGTNPTEDIRDGLTKKCATMDKPIAALIRDLKRLGMLDDTLIVWSGEFGRTPFREGRTAGGKVLGRDHFPDGYCTWLAGAGVKGGYTHGATHELGFGVTEKPVHIHDLQATILHLLGLEHTKLTFRFQGRDFRLTDVHGHVVKDLIA
ncbi:MAG: DUF1501 domain-containing protein [Fimbriiglobus sp.]